MILVFTIKNVLPQLRQSKMKGMNGIGVPPLLGLRLLIHKYDNNLLDIDVFSSPELEAQVSFSDHMSSVVSLSVRLSVNFSYFRLLLQRHPWVKEIQVCSNEGPRPFPRGDNFKIAKIHLRNSKIFSRTT